MQRNIKISYLLSYLKHSWFWAGIWVFYYLRYTDYAGIGLIESVMILTMTLGEIPTGAIGDLLGKKITLFIAFFLESFGNLLMAFAPGFGVLVLSVFIMSFGGTMYSGTSEALLFDSLKQGGKEDKFKKAIANLTSFQWVAVTITSITGGLLYKLNPSYPFVASAIFFGLGALVTLLIKEPNIDTEKFSLVSFIEQNKKGVRCLFANKMVGGTTILLASVGSIIILSWEMLESILGVEFGYTPLSLSFLTAAIFLFSALASQLTSLVGKRFGEIKGILILAIISIITLTVSPFAGFVVGGITLILRSAVQVIIENLTSVILNNSIDSKYRATALSSFNMLKNIPYVLTAYITGYLMNIITARNFAFSLGILLLVIISTWGFTYSKQVFSIVESEH